VIVSPARLTANREFQLSQKRAKHIVAIRPLKATAPLRRAIAKDLFVILFIT
jgi:hypothetical protein